MKKYLLIILFPFPFFSFAQQEFAPIGAVWYYESDGMTSDGFEKITSEKDTSVYGSDCKKLIRSTTFYGFPSYQITTFDLPPMYVYDSSGIYYFFSNGHFSILYDFNKQPGQFWTTDAFDFENVCGPIGKIYVDSAGTENIDGTDLKWMVTHNDSSWFNYLGNGRIYERFGSMQYLFPLPACVIWEGYLAFRCYDDSALHYSIANCDSFFNSIEDVKSVHDFQIFPNPVSEILFVQTISHKQNVLEIYDLLGKNEITISITPTNGIFDIDISTLKTGIHFLRNGNQMQMFIKE